MRKGASRKCGKKIRPEPCSSCSCSDGWVSVRDPQSSLLGRAKEEGKGVFLVLERGKMGKRRQTNTWVCSDSGVTSRVGRRAAGPQPGPLCSAQGVIDPHFPGVLVSRAIITPQLAELPHGQNPSLCQQPWQAQEPGGVPAPGMEQRQSPKAPGALAASVCPSQSQRCRKPPLQPLMHPSKLEKPLSLLLPPALSPAPAGDISGSLHPSLEELEACFPFGNNGPDSRSCKVCGGFSCSRPVQGEFPPKSHLQPWQMCRAHGCHSTFILYQPLTGQPNRIPDVSYPGAQPKALGFFSVVLGCSVFAQLAWHWDIWTEQLPENTDFFPPKNRGKKI